MTLKLTTTIALVAASAAFTPIPDALAQDTRAAEDDCVDTVERDYRPRGRIRVVDTDWAQAGTQVIVEADGKRWSCMANEDGEVWSVNEQGRPGNAYGHNNGNSHGNSHGDRDRGEGVTLYRDTEFRGTSETVHGDVSYLGDTRIGNDELSSIRVPRGCQVWLYHDANFEGRSFRVDGDQRELGRTPAGNDEASSLRVDCGGGGHGSGHGYDDDRYESDGVTLYADAEFRGQSVTLTRDENYLGDTRIGNDSVSSIRVPRGCRAWLYADSEFRGQSIELDRDVSYLGDTRIGNDSVSSIEVECR